MPAILQGLEIVMTHTNARRPTSMGLAFATMATRTIINVAQEKGMPPSAVLATKAVPWVARRVALTEGKVGTVRERMTTA